MSHMALPLIANWTARYRVHYQFAGFPHTWDFRYGFATGAPGAPHIAWALSLIDAIWPSMYSNVAITSAGYCVTGSNVEIPLPTPVPTSSTGATLAQGRNRAKMLTFLGKGEDGRRWALRVHGFNWGSDDADFAITGDFKYTAGENASVTAALVAITASPEPLCIDGTAVIPKQYVTLKEYDPTVKKLRNGA